jgi:hypothetical protein
MMPRVQQICYDVSVVSVSTELVSYAYCWAALHHVLEVTRHHCAHAVVHLAA